MYVYYVFMNDHIYLHVIMYALCCMNEYICI